MSTSTASKELHASVPWARTSSTKWRPWKRLPCRRPCMSANATRTVSIESDSTAAFSASTESRPLRSPGAPYSVPRRQGGEHRRGHLIRRWHRVDGDEDPAVLVEVEQRLGLLVEHPQSCLDDIS